MIKKANINIVDLNISKRSQDFFNIDINLKVNDLKHLDQLMLSLKLEENIYKIKRCKENNEILKIYKKKKLF